MRTTVQKTTPLGELVVAAFDSAARYSADPREVSRLATQAVINILRRRAGAGAFGIALVAMLGASSPRSLAASP